MNFSSFALLDSNREGKARISRNVAGAFELGSVLRY